MKARLKSNSWNQNPKEKREKEKKNGVNEERGKRGKWNRTVTLTTIRNPEIQKTARRKVISKRRGWDGAGELRPWVRNRLAILRNRSQNEKGTSENPRVARIWGFSFFNSFWWCCREWFSVSWSIVFWISILPPDLRFLSISPLETHSRDLPLDYTAGWNRKAKEKRS